MTNLPIDPLLPEIVAKVRDHRCLVLVAPPGAGKTTRVPVALVKAGLLGADYPWLVMLQPRRVAARASAARIAQENGWRLGEEVGYQIRFERRIGRDTRIRVVTEGILNRQLVADPFLEGVGAVILDEFHERSLHTDIALAMLREIRETVRDDLILVVMSATMDPEPVARFLGNAPILKTEGRTFPVEVRYLGASTHPLPDRVASAVESVFTDSADPGDVLAFLPGVEEIRRTSRQLAGWAERSSVLVLPLHGSLDADEQDRALRSSDRRKVILATNIAETSLTIDGVATVIDGGMARFASFDPARGLDRLELCRISKASADQRAGRAGRTRPGRCLRLWSEGEQRGLAESDTPEVLRVDLAGTVLALHAWGLDDPAKFAWFESPTSESLDAAESLLTMLGAIEGAEGAITPLGRRLLEVPAHPRLGRLLIEAARVGLLHEGATLAALLAEKDIVPRSFDRDAKPSLHAASDILIRLDQIEEAERSRFSHSLRDRGVDPVAARQVVKVRDDLDRIGRRLPGPLTPRTVEPDEDELLRLILMAYPDRVVRRRGREDSTGVMVGGRGVRLDPESVVRDAEFFLALDPREDRRGGTLEARVRIASAIDREWLQTLFPGAVRRERTVEFDGEKRRVVGVSTLIYRDLPLVEDRNGPVDPEAGSRVLAQALGVQGRAFFEAQEEAGAWLTRLELARQWMPEGDWPTWEDGDWSALIAAACAGRKSEDEVSRSPLLALLRGRLSYAQGQKLDTLVPESLVVPSGNRIKLTYAREGPPVLAVRLQELFGWTETPRLAGGRVVVVVHLLGPNYRPVQITNDLKSFWASAYFQVRKDLRARYPKHAWPDDPLTARAEARGGRRRDL